MEITHEIFRQQRKPRFGNGNPERMHMDFWEWMIRGAEKEQPSEEEIAGGCIKVAEVELPVTSYYPHDARKFFRTNIEDDASPLWTFQRYGATRTKLPDGRIVCIGGEHEDFYDADFSIYNDVIVFGPEETIEIYGYSKDIFPPTDFHTATLLENKIILVGSLGYRDERCPSHTPVYVLNLNNYSISKHDTSGEAPGWISEHDAKTEAAGVISVRGGKLIEVCNGEQRYKRNFDSYELDVPSGVWSRKTRCNWQHFSIRQKDRRMFVLERDLSPKNLVPSSLILVGPEEENRNQARILIKEVPVLLICGISEIEVIFEGALPNEVTEEVVEQIRSNAESTIKWPCVSEQLQ